MKKMLLCLLAVFVGACFGFDPEQLPDVSKLGPLQTQNALPVAEWGWGNLENGDRITDIPFQSKKPSGIGIPLDTQFGDFALKKPEHLAQVVIDADLRKASYRFRGNELDRMSVYVSSDGKSYAPVKTEVATQFYTVTDKEGKKTIWVRISLKGDFYGQYFRIYTPWGKKFYLFRFINGPKGVKVFAK